MNLPRRIFQSAFFRPVRTVLDPESERLRAFVRRAALSLPPGAVLVDIGAGQCQYKDLFRDTTYIGVDFGGGDHEWDYSRLDAVSDIHALPVRSGIADGVLCTQVLEHTYDPQKVICEMARILKIGGRAFISVPQGWGEHQVPHDYFRYTQYGIKVLLNRAGLKMVEVGKTTGLFGYLANRLTMVPKVLFWSIKNPVLRILLLPVELLCYLLFVAFPAIFLAPLDILDHEKTYTLNYTIIADKAEDAFDNNEKTHRLPAAPGQGINIK